MALFRALESCRRPPAERLFTDPYAAGLLRGPLRLVAALAVVPGLHAAVCRIIDRRWPGARSSGIARTRLIDDAVGAALAAGCRQVVILGAGYDCRAHRLPGIEAARVIEIDHPTTAAAKRARLARQRHGSPAHVTHVPADLDREPLEAVLDAARLDRSAPAFFIWEGVTNYLRAAAVDTTLRAIAGSAAGSRLLFTYVHRGLLDGSVAFAGTTALAAMLARSGEPWTFGLDPAELPDYLAARGFDLLEDLGATDYRARYMGARGPHQHGYAFYRAALARVRGGSTG